MRGMKREELVEPIPGRPCFTGLFVCFLGESGEVVQ